MSLRYTAAVRLARPLVLMLVLLAAFALRLHRLGEAHVWYDEGLAAWAARLPLAAMADWTAHDVHPPLYFALLHFWRRAAGESTFALRLPSVLSGVLAVVALHALARRLAPERPWVALAAAALLAFSRFAVWWSQEARMYMLGALLATLNLYLAGRLVRRIDRWTVLGYLAVTAAALWTLYLLGFLLVIDALYWAWALRRCPRRLVAPGSLAAGALAAFVPWALYTLPRLQSWSVQEPFDPRAFVELDATLLALGVSTDVARVRGPTLAVVAIVAVGVAALVARRRGGLAIPLLAAALPPAIVLALTTVPRSIGYAPRVEARYLLPFAPAFYLLAAGAIGGLADLAGRARGVVGVALLAGFLVLDAGALRDYFGARVPLDEYWSVGATLKAHVREGDAVVLQTDRDWPVFAYYWPGAYAGVPYGQDADPDRATRFLEPVWAGHEGIWLVVNEDALRADPQRAFEAWLTPNAAGREEWRFPSARVVLFARTPARAAALDALAPGFQPLAPIEVRPGRIRAGEPITAAVYADGDLALGDPPITRGVASGAGPRHVLTLALPPDAAPGTYPWLFGRRVVGRTEVVAAATRAAPAAEATPQHPIDATFGDPPLARLLGYDLARGDGRVAVTLYWRVLDTAPLSYKVFVHLDGPDGRPAAQRDDFPSRPTTAWRPGDLIVDRYEVDATHLEAGRRYPIRVGMYDPVSGQRLGPGEQVELGEVE